MTFMYNVGKFVEIRKVNCMVLQGKLKTAFSTVYKHITYKFY